MRNTDEPDEDAGKPRNEGKRDYASPQNKVDRTSAWTSAEEYVKTLAGLVRESVLHLVALPNQPAQAPNALQAIRGVFTLVRPMLSTPKQLAYDKRFQKVREDTRAEQLQAALQEANGGDFESVDKLIDELQTLFDDVMTEAQQHHLGVPERPTKKSATAQLAGRWNAKPITAPR